MPEWKCGPVGVVKPSALAVFRLMTSSNVVGCCIGRSAGFSPLRILPASIAGLPNPAGDARSIADQAAGQQNRV